ncbi:isomerase [Amycolatopsis deserti]|uniref:Isomerase n=1 Tax=Amycolatopsis deserti TaxID=185696 RepID=A0ABQ3INH4_9PSEU|nr:PhzF family phenazine biosynthesis protein [Amycolatopsis deserti]GHE87114.1 isomerase [Amycolatopsis deserti]
MNPQLFLVDAFTDREFGGNPAAVCVLDEPVGEAWMRRVAAELNQPATAFLHERRLRWFTPVTELPLCGHATLAAAHVLYETGRVPRGERLVFQTGAGPLPVSNAGGLIRLEFAPVDVPETADAGPVLDALGLTEAVWVGGNGTEFVVVVGSRGQVEAVRPDLGRIRDLPVGRVLVTAAGGDRADFTSRNFAPALGLGEDHVTGSAHAVLGPLWARRLGRDRLTAVQASARRGRLEVEVRDEAVRVGGRAVTVVAGRWVPQPAT